MQVLATQMEPSRHCVSSTQPTHLFDGTSQCWSLMQSPSSVQPTSHLSIAVQYWPVTQSSSTGVHSTHFWSASSQTFSFGSTVQSADVMHSGIPPTPPVPPDAPPPPISPPVAPLPPPPIAVVDDDAPAAVVGFDEAVVFEESSAHEAPEAENDATMSAARKGEAYAFRGSRVM